MRHTQTHARWRRESSLGGSQATKRGRERGKSTFGSNQQETEETKEDDDKGQVCVARTTKPRRDARARRRHRSPRHLGLSDSRSSISSDGDDESREASGSRSAQSKRTPSEAAAAAAGCAPRRRHHLSRGPATAIPLPLPPLPLRPRPSSIPLVRFPVSATCDSRQELPPAN